jgi:hypothetical protein
MSDEQINIAIAGTCGWAHPSVKPYAFPNYSNDLNAMHEAEEVLTGHQRIVYKETLCEITPQDPSVSLWGLTRATARQRAEAFLKTIGEWEGVE